MDYEWKAPEDAPTDNRIVVVKVKGHAGFVFAVSGRATPSGLQSPTNFPVIAWADLARPAPENNYVGDEGTDSTLEADFTAYDNLPENIKELLMYSPTVCSAEDALSIVDQYGTWMAYRSIKQQIRLQDPDFESHFAYDSVVQYTRLRRELVFRAE